MRGFSLVITMFTIAAILSVALFGMTYLMMMDGGSGMQVCPMTSAAAMMCDRDVVVHIAAWQNILRGITTAVFILTIVLIAFGFLSRAVREILDRTLLRIFAWVDHAHERYFVHPLAYALARGIIHSKRYTA